MSKKLQEKKKKNRERLAKEKVLRLRESNRKRLKYERGIYADIEANKEIRVIRHEQNQGLSASRNTGMSQAKYNLLIPLDADDYFFPNSVKELHDLFGEEDVLYGNVREGTDNSGGVHQPITQPLTRNHFTQRNPLFCSSMFRKTTWERAGGYTVRPHAHYEDWNFWAKAFKAGCVFRYVPVLVYNHTYRPNSMVHQLGKEDHKYRRMALEGF